MNNPIYHIGAGVILGFFVLVVDTYLTLNGFSEALWFFQSLWLALIFVGVCFSVRLPLVIKVFVTSILFIGGVYDALFGRTENVGLTMDTLISTLLMFSILSGISFIPLLRIWRNSQRLLIVSLFPIVSIVSALAIGEIEENVFISLYPEGKRPTERWTVNTAWLAYGPSETDPDGEYVLRGGD